MRTRFTVPVRLGVIAAVALSALVLVAPAARAGISERHGCPAFSFCIYPQNRGWNGDKPSNHYREKWTAPGHVWSNLSNQYGVHKGSAPESP